jgi:hypothetical protein
MPRCESCGGLGRVAAGGMNGQFAGVFDLNVRECAWCHGTGEVTDAIPRPRASEEAGLTIALPGTWRVEIHGLGRILAVMRFVLDPNPAARRFEARCDFGGLLGWQARGEWIAGDAGNLVWFSGTQSSLYVPSAEYAWGATLTERESDILHGESVCAEWTQWTRTTRPAPGTPSPARRLTPSPRAVAVAG